MKAGRVLIPLMIIVLLVLAIGVSLTVVQQSATNLATRTASRSSQRLIAAGDCQSRLWGKLVGATVPVPDGAQVALNSNAQTLTTVFDANGLYGFAGLCPGRYAVRIQTGDPALALPYQFELDGRNVVRQDLAYQ